MIDDQVLRQVIELHDIDCADKVCEPVHFAAHYLNGWFIDSNGGWAFYKDGLKSPTDTEAFSTKGLQP